MLKKDNYIKQDKGFTLIELLAVIVILAIIALIVTPIILNIISESRDKSNQRSVEGYQKAVELTVGEIMVDEDYTGGDITCKLGSKMSDTEKEYITSVSDDETYCWDTKEGKATSRQVTYSGSRVKPDKIQVNMETGEIGIKDAQVGSSSKRYSVGNITMTAVDTIEELLSSGDTVKSGDGEIFIDDYGNIRYRGKDPDNYVEFNDETWRIIGIFDGHIKLIRDESIGNLVWDRQNTWGSGDWTNADLMILLNPEEDYMETTNFTEYKSLYWNRESGECYKDFDVTKDCDFTGSNGNQKGLSVEAQNMIQKTKWYLGGWDDFKILTKDMYIKEREVGEYKDYPLTWDGHVGLMYLSDYGYAPQESCSSQVNLSQYGSSSDYWTGCISSNWLLKGVDEWMISTQTDKQLTTWVSTGNYFRHANPRLEKAVRPVVFLNSSVKITGGEGTSSDRYTLG